MSWKIADAEVEYAIICMSIHFPFKSRFQNAGTGLQEKTVTNTNDSVLTTMYPRMMYEMILKRRNRKISR